MELLIKLAQVALVLWIVGIIGSVAIQLWILKSLRQ